MTKITKIDPLAVYTSPQMRKFLRISEVNQIVFVKSGRLKPSRVGRRYLFLGSEILRFLKDSQTLI